MNEDMIDAAASAITLIFTSPIVQDLQDDLPDMQAKVRLVQKVGVKEILRRAVEYECGQNRSQVTPRSGAAARHLHPKEDDDEPRG